MGRFNGLIKFFATLALLAVLGFCGFLAWQASKIVHVETVTPSEGPVAEAVEATGVVTARNVSQVLAKANLDVKSVKVRAGDAVRAGELIVLAEVDYDSVNSEIMSLEAQVPGLTARLERAEADAAKLGSLYRDGAVSESDRDAALTLQRELESQLEALRHKIDSARNAKQDENVAAPVSGLVTDVFAAEGGTVLAGRPLVEITDMGDVFLTAELTLEDGKLTRVGDRVVIDGLDGVGGYVAKVLPKVSEVISQGTPKKRIDAEIYFDGGPEVFATAGPVIGDEYDIRIVTDEKESVFRVPRSAVFLQSQRYYAYVAASDGRARLRELAVGLRGADYYEVSGGVEAGERLIAAPGAEGLSDGALVRYEGDGGGSTLRFLMSACF
ncbi:MAG: efflux RND transporter periplasmic adaptor subunit [Clostridiales Family XIII bacterium]|jgi:RND family efflux transporter MFP subunit|nr:efflux RND transporter periplasmic adaptor subunit [Clostridiales Family XIII bacterium]